MDRDYWMVQYRLTADHKLELQFAETHAEAEREVQRYTELGYYASFWKL